MFNAKYLITLKRFVFPNSEFPCLGQQLLDILEFIKDLLPSHVWYGADIETNGESPWGLRMNSFELKRIGNFSAMEKIAQETDQFRSGVFLAIRADITIKADVVEVGALDPQFEPRDLEGVLIEIRAFDSAYFEVYSDNYDLMKKISNNYKVEINTAQDIARKHP